MPFTLKPLPYSKDALEPTISARTLEFHHGQHHRIYVERLNQFTAGTPFADADLESIIRATAGKPDQKQIFNNAAQTWNHDFFWESLAPNGGGHAPEPVLKRIQEAFQSFDNFREKFVDVATKQFGSGWTWLVIRNGKLQIMSTHDADVPFTSGAFPLVTCDVWEHAYYLDYQHKRADFVKAFIDKAINWQHVGKRLVEADK